MIWRAGLDAKCDYFDRTWLAFTGRTLAEEIGEGWTEGVHPEDFTRCVQYYLDHFERRAAMTAPIAGCSTAGSRITSTDGSWASSAAASTSRTAGPARRRHARVR